MKSKVFSSVVLLLILSTLATTDAALGDPSLGDTLGTAVSALIGATASTASTSLMDSSTSIASTLSAEATAATTNTATTSAASTFADSTSSAASTLNSATSSAASTLNGATSSAATSLAQAGTGSRSTTSTGGAVTPAPVTTAPVTTAPVTTAPVTPPNPITTSQCGSAVGTGCQDPHFVGFDGSVFDFQGITGNVFGIISDTMLQVNALFSETGDGASNHFADSSWMNQVGVMCFQDSVIVSSPKKFDVKIVTSKNGPMEVSQSATSVNIRCGSFWNVTISNDIDKILWGYSLRVHASVLSTPVTSPHGVLGQTLRYIFTGDQKPHPVIGWGKQGAGVVEGQVQDYVVKDGLLGTDFKFNKFIPQVVNRDRTSKRASSRTLASASAK